MKKEILVGVVSFVFAAMLRAEVRLDFGTEASPVAEGWTRITSATETKEFRWIERPTEAVDVPHAYPLDDLSRDGVRFTTEQPLEFEIELPRGTYEINALLGERGDSWRPGMFLEVNGKKIISAVYGFIGTPMWSRARVEHEGGVCRVRLEVERPTFATGSLLALRFQQSDNDTWKPLREDAQHWRPAIRWIAAEKIRMIYGIASQRQFDEKKGHFVDTTPELWQRAAASGMNCVATAYTADIARYFSNANMRLWHVVQFATGEKYTHREHEFEKNVLSDGRMDNRPNPLDANAWQELVVKEALEVWRQSVADGTPLSGIAIDLEMYGAKHMEVYHNACTFDEAAFVAFCREHFSELPEPEKIAAEMRYQTLLQSSKLQSYYQYLETRMAAVAREVETAIHREAPDLLIGYLQHFDNWFFRGLDKGLGTREMPVVAFGENTYYGYNGDAPFTQTDLKNLGAHALYCAGLWPQTIHPDKFWKDAFLSGIESSGFWLYGYGYPMSKEDNTADLDNALRRANSAILHFLKNGEYADLGEVDHTLKTPFRKGREVNALDIVDADPHPTLLTPLSHWSMDAMRFDFGRPDSALTEGWVRVGSFDIWKNGAAFGWLKPARYSFDRRENAAKILGKNPMLALLSGGIATEGKNAFLVKVAAGNYKVTAILGDLAPNEYRTHQSVSANGILLASDATTNAQEYRAFAASSVPEKDGVIRIDFEGRGAQQQVSILGIVIEPEGRP